tara:strand:- start:228 stop:371 length:144 start_codon:yes stop_codon:yes gene_type:complete
MVLKKTSGTSAPLVLPEMFVGVHSEPPLDSGKSLAEEPVGLVPLRAV